MAAYPGSAHAEPARTQDINGSGVAGTRNRSTARGSRERRTKSPGHLSFHLFTFWLSMSRHHPINIFKKFWIWVVRIKSSELTSAFRHISGGMGSGFELARLGYSASRWNFYSRCWHSTWSSRVQDGGLPICSAHPSYSGSLLALVGIACLTFNWLAFFLIMTCSLIAYALRISVEEKALHENLGP